MESEKRMLLDVNEFPKSKGQAFILALQHVLAMTWPPGQIGAIREDSNGFRSLLGRIINILQQDKTRKIKNVS